MPRMFNSVPKFFLLFILIDVCQLGLAQTTHNVVCSDVVGCSVSANTLTKNVPDAWGNSAATGLYYLEENTDGFIEYTIDAMNRKAFGLSDVNSNNFTGSID